MTTINGDIPGCTVLELDPDDTDSPERDYIAEAWKYAITAITGDNTDARSHLIAVREAFDADDTMLTVWDADDNVPVLLVGRKS